jgi:hypothetical protein
MPLADITEAVWTYGTRTLVSGTPDPPDNRAEEVAEAVWEYVSRTLTGAPASTGAAFPRWRSVRR